MAKLIPENKGIVRAANRLKAYGKQAESQPGMSNLAGGGKKKKALMNYGKRPKKR